MPRLWGRDYTRLELLRHVGRLEQAAGVRLVTLGDGLGRGVRLLEFRTGSGFSFDVVVDRTFDIGRCELDGRALAWLANPGIVGPWYYEAETWGWFRAWGGGMVVTCGLDHTLGPGEDDASDFHQPHIFKTVPYGLHGRVGGLPARLVGYGERWEGDECVLWAEGEVLQSAIFGEHLLLRRRIEARVGESRFTIHDGVENVGHSRTSHMLLYHSNAGFPVVDEGSELLVPAARTTTDYGVPIEGYRTLAAPTQDFTEACFEHELVAERAGTVPVAVVNRALGLGVYQVFRIEQLAHHTVWRMMGEDTYAMALEPSTNRDAGRWNARERGELLFLEPGEVRAYDLEIGALSGATELDAFGQRVARVMAGAGVAT
ncbi:MAG: aldose 1-epimerase family protein [Candidatus Limnocylindrales bacterium]